MAVTDRKRAVVIGGGLAGLSAARRLKDFGWSVLVLEKETEVGGRCRTVLVDGFAFDTAAQFLRDSYDSTLKTAIDIGLGACLRLPNSGKGLFTGGLVHPFVSRAHNPLDLLPWRSLGLAGLRDVPRLTAPLVRRYRSYDVRFPELWSCGDDETALDFAHRLAGQRTVRSFAEPVAVYAMGASLGRISAAAFLAGLRTTFADRTGSLTGGMGALPTTLARGLDVRTSIEASEITVSANRAVAVKARPTGGGRARSFRADLVVCATPAGEVHRLSPVLGGVALGVIDGTGYSPEAVVNLGFAASSPGPAGPVMLPSVEGFKAAWVCTNRSKAFEHAPKGAAVVTAVFSGDRAESLLECDDERLRDLALEEAARVLRLQRRDLCAWRVDRHRLGRPVPSTGHAENVRELRRSGSGVDGLVLAGDWTTSPTAEGAVSSGLIAAKGA